MEVLSDIFVSAVLADATYALDETTMGNITGNQISGIEKLVDRMTPKLAEYIGDNFTVVTHYESSDYFNSGFDATVWQRNSDGKYFVSMQGTAGLMDFVTDADLTASGTATAQIIDMVNWWLRVTTPVGQEANQYAYLSNPGPDVGPVVVVPTLSADGEGLVSDIDSVEVVGHSLGGHLAAAFTRLFPDLDASALLINGAGFADGIINGLSGNADINVNNLFGTLGPSNQTSFGDILNLHGSAGWNFVSQNLPFGLVQPGGWQEIFTESSATSEVWGHGKEQMTDSLAVYDLFLRLDAGLASSSTVQVMSTLRPFFEQSSNVAVNSLESVVNTFGRMFVDDYQPIEEDSDNDTSEYAAQVRGNLYGSIFAIQDAISNKSATILSIPSAMSQLAEADTAEGRAYRYALENLDPFVIVPSDTSGTSLGDQKYDVSNFSHEYLEDRTAMLHTMLSANSNDTDYDDVRGVYFSDAETGAIVGVTSDGFLAPDNKKTVFGSENSDNLSVGNNNDHLYGAGGNDTLIGAAGDDYLEGGSGDDVLNSGVGFDRLNGGAGNDVYQIDLSNFGDAIISGDTDSGTIALLSGVIFRKATADTTNPNGVYLAVDDQGEWRAEPLNISGAICSKCWHDKIQISA